MPYLLTLTMALLLTACVSSSSEPKLKNISKETKKKETIQLEGKYSFEKGIVAYGGGNNAINKQINSSSLIIEKLDKNDFGYYYTTQVEERYTGKYFGIFHYKDGQYHQKVIEDNGKVSILDNLELIQEGKRLKLTVKTNHGKRILIWNKNPKMTITKDLKEAKQSYIKICKDKYMKIEKD